MAASCTLMLLPLQGMCMLTNLVRCLLLVMRNASRRGCLHDLADRDALSYGDASMGQGRRSHRGGCDDALVRSSRVAPLV